MADQQKLIYEQYKGNSLFSQNIFLRYPDQLAANGFGNINVLLDQAHKNLLNRMDTRATQQIAVTLQTSLNALYNDNSWDSFAKNLTETFIKTNNLINYRPKNKGQLAVTSLEGHSAKQAVTVYEKSKKSKGTNIKNRIKDSGIDYTLQWWNLLQSGAKTADELKELANSYFAQVRQYNGKINELAQQYLLNLTSAAIDDVGKVAVDKVMASLYGDSDKIRSRSQKAAYAGKMAGKNLNTLGDLDRQISVILGEKTLRIYESKQKTDISFNLKFPGDEEKTSLGVSSKSMTKLRQEINLVSGLNVFGALTNTGLGANNNKWLYSALTVYNDWEGVTGVVSVDLERLNKLILIQAMRGVTETEQQAEFMVLWTGTGSKQPFRVISTSAFLGTEESLNRAMQMATFIHSPTPPPIGSGTQGIREDTGGRTVATLNALLNWTVSVKLSSEAYKLASLNSNWGIA